VSGRAALVGLVLFAVGLASGAGARVASQVSQVIGDSFGPDTLPEPIKQVPPVYPDSARRVGVEGTVVVDALVGKDGLVKAVRIHPDPRCSIPALDEAALAAARQWVFKPAKNDNKPVAVWVAIPVKFSLDSKPQAPKATPPPEPTVARQAFVQEVAALQAQDMRQPSASDSALRRRIIRDALALDPGPPVPDEAREHFARAQRARDRGSSRDSLQRAVDEFTATLNEAPWWGPAYLELGRALQRLGRGSAAAISLELYLLAEPESLERAAIQRQIAKLRSGSRTVR
jgi:TonB family protein